MLKKRPSRAALVTTSALSVVGFLLLWEAVCRLGAVDPIFLPPPSAVLNKAAAMLQDGMLWNNVLASARRVMIGFLAATAVAIPLGIMLGTSSFARAIFDPILSFLRPLPSMSWIPLSLLWFGISETQKYSIVFMGTFAPALVFVIEATRGVDPLLLRAAQNLGASRWQVMREVVLPASLPQILSGLKVILGLSWTCVISAELVAAREGLGFLIMNGKEFFQTEIVVLGMVLISSTVLITDFAFPRHRGVGAEVAAMSTVAERNMISIQGISKHFGEFKALERVDLNVEKGEFVVLLGASGCGKSTLLNLVAGFEQPTSGSIHVNGREVRGVDPHCGMVFQQYALFPWLTVEDKVAFGLKMKGVPKAERQETAHRFIEMVGLRGFEKKFPGALSGGMRQRVSIARVLANDPDVILLDEPFAALDAMTRQVLQDELLQIYEKSRKTIIFITHSIDEALLLSTRMLIMSARPGRVVTDIRNDLPMPRNADVQLSARYNELKSQIWGTVQAEVMRSLHGN